MLKEPINILEENRRLGAGADRLIRISGITGGVALAIAVVFGIFFPHGGQRFFHAYLANFCFFLSLALGGLFFVILQHVTRSGWSVVVRRMAENVAATLPLMAVLFVPLLFGMGFLYVWTDTKVVAEDHLLQIKRPYLNPTFFVIRVAVYFLIWVLLARYFRGTSIKQDPFGDPSLTLRMQRASAPAVVIYALTTTFAAFDLLMSLDPHWYSTIFGVYYFSGAIVGFFALLTLLTYLIQRAGYLERAINEEHYHDLGKLMFAFIVFWAYIAFSQYMLIWYANIPEETAWYRHRQDGGWAWVSLVLLFGHFVAPFIALISRGPKRRPHLLVFGAAWVLLMHWIDIYWLALPGASYADGKAAIGLTDIACFIGLGGLFVAVLVYQMRGASLVPERDPRLPESLLFENV